MGGGGGSAGTGAGLVAVGGSSGGGGNGGKVEVQNSNTISVSGNGAGFELGNYGIFAQSIGGGGGSANASGGLVAIGGTGGPGGNSGTVSVTNSGSITSHCTNCRDAGAIYAQSVGGGGGRGGNSGGLFAIGGSGGSGGTSSAVTVSNSGALETHGTFSRGIFAQSIGGGGGDGGFAGGVFTGGGPGGEGGSAANPLRIGGKGNAVRNDQFGAGVTVNNSGGIETFGDDSQGIFAQSVGGGGGNGGGSVAVGAFIAIAVGGSGGIGGDGGLVTVNNTAADPALGPVIETSGERSAGVFAQSVGGGGGSGGFAVAASGGIFGGFTAAFGGDGAAGGDGGEVVVNSNGSITTRGSFASGIYAESIGGGGGRGGIAVAAGVTVTGVQATLSFGGEGGAGGTGNDVTVDNASKITTGCNGCTSDESHGIFASSIGGGGGSGGASIAAGGGQYGTVSLSFGGNAGTGNSSGVVDVTNTGEIVTHGRQSHGILAQSIGGGGGSGGFSGSLSFALSGVGAAALSFGGDGGEGGAGNTVTIDNSANITTFGQGSAGILAQSIGGGGGNGGFAGVISFSVSGLGAFANSLGGEAGSGSLGRNVTVTHAGAIRTHGDNATGILAQSVGGGGGNGGFSLAGSGAINGQGAKAQSVGGTGGDGGRSGIVKVGTSGNFVSGSIETSGALAHGIQAQSIAGGGGNGGFSAGLGFTISGDAGANSVGGGGGSGQHASQFIDVDGEMVEIASVEVYSNASILTGAACAANGAGCTAVGSHGIFAQSVGGGGGAGGFSITDTFSLDGDADANSTGGSGAGGGDGGMVIVTSGGEITTRGANSHGILAQSIGGGGGAGAFSIAGSVSINGDGEAQSVGGSGGAAGDASTVTVNALNNISTVGAGSHGILAQSVGGGGGAGGFSIAGSFSLEGDADASSVGGSGAGGGDGGMVVVTSSGEITTGGVNSHGILAQSVGGGGGSGAFSIAGSVSIEGEGKVQSVGGSGGTAGDANTVTVNVLNNISTVGALSHGVLAQSVGGGGGDGGFGIAAGFSLQSDASTSSVGGGGSGGGDGQKVTVNVGSPDTPLLFPTIHTTGQGSIGVFAQSVGGGGGSGGFSGGLALSIDGKAENSVGGGNGGAGGMGGEVQVTNWGIIKTEGDNAAGVLAQSVGGGGGNGGFSIAGSLGDSAGIANSIGGSAGGGGKGSKVQVDNHGLIETSGNFSHGIIAQSIGGGGGNGGFSIGLGVTLSGSQGSSSSKVGGGAGGAGGDGGEVIVNNTGTIRVTGANAFGIFAQSVGGGGGSGGIAGGLAIGGSLESTVGGDGGKGGSGGDVTVISTGDIITTGANSSAVFAQSVAGSGGWSGLAIGLSTGSKSDGVTLGLGSRSLVQCLSTIVGCLPADGTQGKVTVTINGVTTVTEGDLSYGLLAQAIGGGGGALGTVLEGALSFFGSDVVVEVGSNGSLSGNAAFADVSYTNNTATDGLGSIGLIAQSIGGGGGVNAFTADQLDLNPAQPPEDSFILRVGGYAQNATFTGTGSGGGFKLIAQGTVTTNADNAIGIVGQTIGGGGGIGTITVSTVNNDGEALEITVGGSQLTDGPFVGNAGPASTLTAQQKVTTKGALSHGIVAQSIGGGGGIANVVFQNGVTLTDGVDVTIGSGVDGAGGNGGVLTVTASGVETSGAGAMGIVAQSIGGGGGLTGVYSGGALLGQNGFSLTPVTISAGGASKGGDGGEVTVISNGDVRTSGFGAHGIVAQSIAGGGGIVGAGMFATTLGENGPFAGSTGKPGTAGEVSVTHVSNIVVAGEQSVGIFGQSAGSTGNGNVVLKIDQSAANGNGVGLIWAAHGSGAAVQFADGAANSLSTNGTLYARGSTLTPNLSGIEQIPNVVPNLFILPDLGGLAVLGGSGGEAITNESYALPALGSADYGVVFDIPVGTDTAGNTIFVGTRTSTIIGNLDLGTGANSLLNEEGALLLTDQSIKLGGGLNTLTNAGLLSPGDRGRVQITEVDGSLTQTTSGKYFIDVDLNQQNTGNPVTDQLDVTGSSDVGGEGPLLLLSINKAFAGPGDPGYVIVHSDGGTTSSGFTPTLTPAAVGFDFKTEVRNGGHDLVLFAEKPPFLSLLQDPASGTTDPNVWRMGKGIDNIEQAITVDDPFNYLVNLLRLQPDHKALGDAVVTLTPSQAPHLFEMTYRRTVGFLDQTTTCPFDSGRGVYFDRQNCVWGQGSYGEYRRGSVQDSPVNDDHWSALTLGGQAAVNANWQVGFGFEGSETSSTQVRDGSYLSSLSGDLYQLSLSANYRGDGNRGFGVGFVTAASHGSWDAKRFVNIDGFSQTFTSFDGIQTNVAGVGEQPAFSEKKTEFKGITGFARSEPELLSINQRIRLSYLEQHGPLQIIPFFDIDGYLIHSKSRNETGVGLANLTYPSITNTTVTFTPGLELGLTHQIGAATALRGFVRGGVTFAPDDSWTAKTQFIAAPDGLPPIKIIDEFDNVLGKVDAGLMLFNAEGHQLQLNYSGAFGETTTQHEVRGGFTLRF